MNVLYFQAVSDYETYFLELSTSNCFTFCSLFRIPKLWTCSSILRTTSNYGTERRTSKTNPNWHDEGYFYPLVLFGSDFFSSIFIKKFQTFFESENGHKSG